MIEPRAWFYEEKGWMPGDGKAEFSEYRWDEHQRANWEETPLTTVADVLAALREQQP